MPFYHKLGKIPHKRHTQFRKPDGSLYREQVIGTKGFSGIQSILYHTYQPTEIKFAESLGPAKIDYVPDGALRHRLFKTRNVQPGGDAVSARQVLMGNANITMALARPTQSMDYHYRNGEAHELYWVHSGEGVLHSQYGSLPFGAGDYINIPISTTWRMELKGNDHRMLVFESPQDFEFPKRYRNEYGQLLENSPFCERDMRVPEALETHTERGEFEVRVKARGEFHRHILTHHPLDVVGWDGYLYPFAFNIYDFEPITGRVHQPPPVHQTWEGWNFVICSFMPRLFDYHPLAIPAPYNHANVNSDEVLYYAEGNFMSRKGVEQMDISLHPGGLPHGPHPGTIEASIGKAKTEEVAVMMDTFHPLHVTPLALECEDERYAYSWVE
ncbi:MAG: homogentisate 1,2-dioxygenase [Chloroflexota bacterium]|nr:MAG: homogentisate 1,2-dioxygenase [Chloroflexota bacterium]